MTTDPYRGDWYPSTTIPGAQPPAARASINTGQWSVPEVNDEGPDNYLYGLPIARAWRRVTAGAIDLFATCVVPFGIVTTLQGEQAQDAGVLTVFWVLFVVVFINSCLLPISLGKRLLGIQVVRPVAYNGGKTLARVGWFRTLVRLFLHFFELAFYLWVVAFLNRRYQRTLSDTFTHVLHLHPDGGVDPNLPAAPSGSVDLT